MMSDSRLLRGASVAAGGMIYQQVVSLASGLIVARIIGAAEYGVFNLARNLVQIASIVTRLGLDLGLQRFFGAALSEEDRNRWTSCLVWLRRIGFAASLVPVVLLGAGLGSVLEERVYHFDDFGNVLLVLCLSLPFVTDIGILGGAYRGMKQLTPAVVAEFVLLPTMRLAITLTLFAVGWRLWAAVVASTIGALIASAYLALRANRDLPSNRHAHVRRDCRQILAVSSVLAGAMLVTVTTRATDVLFLGHYVAAAEVGQYTLAQMMLAVVGLFGNAFGQSLGPLIAERYGAGDLDGMGRLLRTNSRWVALAAAPIYAVLFAWGHEVAQLFGPSFEISRSVMGWLGASTLLVTVLASNGYALSMTGQHRSEFRLLLIGLALAVIFCSVLIPPLGQVGAAIAAFLALAGANALRVWKVRRLFLVQTIDPRVLPAIAGNVGIALVLALGLELVIEPTAIRVLVGSIAFACISLPATWRFGISEAERNAILRRFARSS